MVLAEPMRVAAVSAPGLPSLGILTLQLLLALAALGAFTLTFKMCSIQIFLNDSQCQRPIQFTIPGSTHLAFDLLMPILARISSSFLPK